MASEQIWGILNIQFEDPNLPAEVVTLNQEPELKEGVLAFQVPSTPNLVWRYIPLTSIRDFYLRPAYPTDISEKGKQ